MTMRKRKSRYPASMTERGEAAVVATLGTEPQVVTLGLEERKFEVTGDCYGEIKRSVEVRPQARQIRGVDLAESGHFFLHFAITCDAPFKEVT